MSVLSTKIVRQRWCEFVGSTLLSLGVCGMLDEYKFEMLATRDVA